MNMGMFRVSSIHREDSHHVWLLSWGSVASEIEEVDFNDVYF